MKKKRNEEKDMTKDFFEALDILEKERKISKKVFTNNKTPSIIKMNCKTFCSLRLRFLFKKLKKEG